MQASDRGTYCSRRGVSKQDTPEESGALQCAGSLTATTRPDMFNGLSQVCPTATAAEGQTHIPRALSSWRFSVPNIKSAKKDLRKSRAAAIRNRAQRSTLRTAVKKARTAAAADTDRLSAVSLLDRAARKGLIHRNTAARQKSRLAKLAAKAAA